MVRDTRTVPFMFFVTSTAFGCRVRLFACVRKQNVLVLPVAGCDCYAYGLLAAGFADLVVEADLKPYDYMALVPIIKVTRTHMQHICYALLCASCLVGLCYALCKACTACWQDVCARGGVTLFVGCGRCSDGLARERVDLVSAP